MRRLKAVEPLVSAELPDSRVRHNHRIPTRWMVWVSQRRHTAIADGHTKPKNAPRYAVKYARAAPTPDTPSQIPAHTRLPGQGVPVAVGELKPFALHAHLLLPGALSRLWRLRVLVAVAGGGDNTLSEKQLELVEQGRILGANTDRAGVFIG